MGQDETNFRVLDAGEFVRRFKQLITEPEDSKFAFFIGAGCSISSGIPGAEGLVKNWLPRLKKLKKGDESNYGDYKDWAKKQYGYDGNNAASLYGTVIKDLFLTPEERQREIERITEGKDPGFGYAVLAQLMGHKNYGSHCNSVLTVNFDDLVADALYLYTQKKPLVISHDSLVGFVKLTRTRPLVIKLHGDARLEPKNTSQETEKLDENVGEVIKNFLSETGLIFVGYGRYDESIAELLKDLPESALPWGIYWINDKIPDGEIGQWLKERDAVWVKHTDFDELMLLIRDEFGLDHPDKKRFEKLNEQYYKTFYKLKNKIEEKPKEMAGDLPKALKNALEDAKSWWVVELEADKYKTTDPEKSDIIYQNGIQKFPQSAPLIGNYAKFLYKVRKDYDKAEENYKNALEIEPENANNLGNYAVFLSIVRKDYDNAEKYYKKMLVIEPENAKVLGNYAIFLHTVKKDYDAAEEYYRKALEIEPENANILGNYSGFLLARGDEKGFDLLRKSLELVETYPGKDLPLECLFYMYAHTRSVQSMDESLDRIKVLLREGIRSPGWGLSENVKRAVEDGHPNPEFLDRLSKVISDEVNIKTLDDFDEWTQNN